MKTNRFKFRAWDILDKKMLTLHHLCLFPESDGRTIAVMAQDANLYPMDRVIVMQSTGLTDKNGVEIFEGDVICCHNYCLADEHDHNKNIGVVEYGRLVGNSWGESAYGFEINSLFNEGNISFSLIYDCEVIGNIHDNPTLLKAE